MTCPLTSKGGEAKLLTGLVFVVQAFFDWWKGFWWWFCFLGWLYDFWRHCFPLPPYCAGAPFIKNNEDLLDPPQ